MLSYAVGRTEAGQQDVGNMLPVESDLGAHLADPLLRALRFIGTERVLLLEGSDGLQRAMTRAVASGRLHTAKTPPDAALGSFDLCILAVSGLREPTVTAKTGAAAASLRPGGRLVILAQNPQSLQLWPRVAGFDALWKCHLSRAGTGAGELEGSTEETGLEETGLDPLRQIAGLRPLGENVLSCCGCQDRDRVMALASNLIAALAKAEGKSIIPALQRWRDHPNASFSHSVPYAIGRRRMREYLTLLPGAELAFSGS